MAYPISEDTKDCIVCQCCGCYYDEDCCSCCEGVVEMGGCSPPQEELLFEFMYES